MSRLRKPALPAQIRVVSETLGQHGQKRAVRRICLVDRVTGLPYELPTNYIYRQLTGKSLNTHRAALQDLAFYIGWLALKQKRSGGWISPESRVRTGNLPLTTREIDDLSGWCQKQASDLALALQRERRSVNSIAAGSAVEPSTTNRRLETICSYLVWLITEFIEGSINIQDQAIARSVEYRKRISENFQKSLNAVRKAAPILSLSEEQSRAIRSVLHTSEIFPNTVQGNRDRLITELLLASGLRAGELLKLYTNDVDDSYKITPNKIRGMVNVVRRPNDIWDERQEEPAVKTFPGPVLISSHLASEIKNYVIGDRRIAVNRRADQREHPYLFVCHSGPNIGRPISRRNLNRIIAKLKQSSGLPAWISPHILRHTHLTEFADRAEEAGKSDADIHALLIQRGHWGVASKMPAHYTKRRIERQEAELTAERDRRIEPQKKPS